MSQRDHSAPIGFRREAAFVALVSTMFLAVPVPTVGCGGDDWPAMKKVEPLQLVAVGDVVRVKPGKTAPISFKLTFLTGKPAPGEPLSFAAIDDPSVPGNDLAGATLGASVGVTDGMGIATVAVTGGQPATFWVSAHHPRADPAEVRVDVSEGDQGSLSVLAMPVAGSAASTLVTNVDLLLFESQSCSKLSLIQPPKPVRPIKNVALGVAGDFNVTNRLSSAVVGQGKDPAGSLRAVGCVDVSANTIVGGQTVRVYLPLVDLLPIPRGTFTLSSHFSLAKREIARRLAAPWQDLADCPLDPGQLWLDCAVDALSSDSGDVLDCVPASTGEGALGDAITARRGTAAMPGSTCRASATTEGGPPTLDAQVAALFPNPAQPPARDLAVLGSTLATILDDVQIESTLALQETSSSDLFDAVHTLRAATFQVGDIAGVVDIVAQGNPLAQARFVSVTTDAGVLSVEAHRLALRLGSLAHVAFAKVALAKRGWPTETGPLLNLLFGLASTGTAAARKTGCDALDDLICVQVGRTSGCLRAACVAGQAALATRLDAAFDLVDGDGTDLQLSGSAPMIDDNVDGYADRLGLSAQDSGLWAAQLRAHAGTEIVSGSWIGTPQTQ